MVARHFHFTKDGFFLLLYGFFLPQSMKTRGDVSPVGAKRLPLEA
jgi:hypothetical protein